MGELKRLVAPARGEGLELGRGWRGREVLTFVRRVLLCLLNGIIGGGGFEVTSWLRDVSVQPRILGKRGQSAACKACEKQKSVTVNVCCSHSDLV